MATPVVFNAVNYSVPAFGDVGYAQGPGNLSAYLIALASGTLQPTGGLFSLTADANFGPNFGLVSVYYKSASANIAQSGVLRLANTDFIAWRNFANSADLPLAVNTSDELTFKGVALSTVAAGSVGPGLQFQIPYYAANGNAVSAAANIHYNAAGDFEVIGGHNVVFDGATSGAVSMKAPAIVTSPYTFTLPPDPGSNAYVLQTNGSGTTTWVASGGVGTFEYVTYTVGTPSGTYTGSTTVFNLPFSYVTDGKHIEVYYNGQQLRFNNDYTETLTTSVTTTSPLIAGQAVWFRAVTGGVSAPSTVTLLRENYIVGTPSGTYTGSLTVFNLGNSYNVGGNAMMVTLDGDVQTAGASADYLETNSTTVTFNNTLVAGERVSFIWSQTIGASGGIVNPGTINQLAFYAATGATVSGTPAITTSGSAVTTTVPTAIAGTTTNNNASAGQVGEYVSSPVGTTAIVASNTGQDITTISLTPGDWDVTGMVKFSINTATWTKQLLYVATGDPGNSFAGASNFNSFEWSNASSSTTPTQVSVTVANVRVSIASPTTIQLKARSVFSAGTPQVEGSITARRVR